MNAIGQLLGLTAELPVLILGDGDGELEQSLAEATHGRVTLSVRGTDATSEAAQVAVLSRGVVKNADDLGVWLGHAHRALAPRGVVMAEVPGRHARFAQLMLTYEGLLERGEARAAGLSYGAVETVARQAGFARVSRYLSLPHMADPRVLLPLDSKPALAAHYAEPFYVESRKRSALRRALATAARLGVLRQCVHKFTIVATKGAE